MSGRRTYVVACLAGHGIGPEVTAAASRALAQLSRQHGFRIDEVHPPFDGEAVLRSGHPLPAATRRATRAADAVLVAGATAHALEGVKAELDLVTQVTRVLTVEGTTLTTFASLDADATDWTLERAFASARERAGRVVSVGVKRSWQTRVSRYAEQHDGVDVTHLTLAEALRALARDPGSLGLLVVEDVLADAVMQAPRLGGQRHLAATALLSPTGPGVFAPTHGAAHDIAGQGVANPSEMLVAAALLLDEGLQRRAAAQALEESLAAALRSPHRPADMTSNGVAATTREFVDVVLGMLPSARRDTEFAMAVTR